MVASTTAIPGPVAIAAGTTTATAARITSGTAARRRTSVGSPNATTPSSTTAATTAKTVVREAGTAAPFQMPPRLARLPSVPSPGSARAANARTPSACVADNESATAAAASHGNATSTAVPSPTAAHHHRGRPGPGAKTHVTATVTASISPVGVNPASAIQNTSAATPAPPPVRRRIGRPQVQHRRRHPRQAAVAHHQAPVPLQESFGDIRIPDGDRHRDELTGQPRSGQHRRRQPRRAPARQQQPGHQQHLDHQAAVDQARRQRDDEILWQRAWRRFGQPERRIGQVRPRRRHRVAEQQIPRRQKWRRHDQSEHQRVRRRDERPRPRRRGNPHGQTGLSGGRSDGREAGSFSVCASAPGTRSASEPRAPKNR